MDAAILEGILADVSRLGPGWKLSVEVGKFVVSGTIRLEVDGESFGEYDIEIIFDDAYPDEIPKVWEVGGKIPREPGRHLNGGVWNACLFVEDERWTQWPNGSTFYDFVVRPVRNFFIGQIVYERTEKFPWGERPHNFEGSVDFYEKKLCIKGRPLVLRFLELCISGPDPSLECPCGSGKQLRSCHADHLERISKEVPKTRMSVVCESIRRNDP